MNAVPRVLLFPAGTAQREAFLAARELGFYIVAVDRDSQAACRDLADEFFVLDPGDADAFVAFALDYHGRQPLAGAVVVGCDIPVSCARVTAALGTPGPSVKAAALTVDKLRMKQVLRDQGVAVPDFYPVSSAAEVEAIMRRHNRRMIIKPNDNSGARGVRQLNPDSNFALDFAEAARNVKHSGVVLEAFELGPQISTEALIYQGEIFLTGFADRNYEYIDRFFPHVLENGATLPSSLSSAQQREVVDMFFNGIRALGIDNCVAKGDMVYTPEGAKVIEIAGRISGGKFASMIVPESSGVQLLHAALQVAVGQAPDSGYLRASRCRGVAVRYLFPDPGRLVALEGVEFARNVPGVLELVTSYRVGDVIDPICSHPDRGGWVVCAADDRETAVARAEEAISHIRFITVPV